MGSQDQHSVIQRKARAARDVFETREMSPAKALRLSLAREADALFDLALTVATVEQMRLPLADIGSVLDDDGLLVLLDGAGGGPGALRLDPAFLSALIEVQTIGSVQTGRARPRAPTRTDAAMVAPLIDAVLAGMDRQFTGAHETHPPLGLAFGDMVETLRALSLVLVGPDFDLLRLTVDIGPGIKTGKLDLLLPHRPPSRAAAPDTDARAARASEDLGTVVLNAPIVLDAAIARLILPLREVWQFKPGDLVPIPREAIGDTVLLGTNGHVVARGRLGRMNGARALQISTSGTAPLSGAPEMAPAGQGVLPERAPADPSAAPAPAPPALRPDQNAPAAALPAAAREPV